MKRDYIRYRFLEWSVLILIVLFFGTGILKTREMDKEILWQRIVAEEDDVFYALKSHIDLPESKVNLDSTFTIRNEGHSEIGEHALGCQIILGKSPHMTIEKSSMTNESPSSQPIGPGGDAQSEGCIRNAYGSQALRGPDPWLSCMDILIGIEYSLTSHPEIKKNRTWRYLSDARVRNYEWIQQPITMSPSPCGNVTFGPTPRLH